MSALIAAFQIVPGDLVDLEGDQYADPGNDNTHLQSELVEVACVEQETPRCVAIGFEGFDVVGFPTHHLLRVKRGVGFVTPITMGAPDYDHAR